MDVFDEATKKAKEYTQYEKQQLRLETLEFLQKYCKRLENHTRGDPTSLDAMVDIHVNNMHHIMSSTLYDHSSNENPHHGEENGS